MRYFWFCLVSFSFSRCLIKYTLYRYSVILSALHPSTHLFFPFFLFSTFFLSPPSFSPFYLSNRIPLPFSRSSFPSFLLPFFSPSLLPLSFSLSYKPFFSLSYPTLLLLPLSSPSAYLINRTYFCEDS